MIASPDLADPEPADLLAEKPRSNGRQTGHPNGRRPEPAASDGRATRADTTPPAENGRAGTEPAADGRGAEPAANGRATGDAAPAAGARATREDTLAAAGHNVLRLPAEAVDFDLVTDSWAEFDGPAAEARMRALADRPAPGEDPLHPSWLPLSWTRLCASGTAAQDLLCAAWPGPRGTVLHNAVFPTWLPSLAAHGFVPVSLVDDPARAHQIDAAALEQALAAGPVSFVCLELSPNAAGGRPVSRETLRAVREATRRHGVPLVLDAARVVENALALGAGDPWPVVRELLAEADAVTLSLTKDFGVSQGGLVAGREPALGQAVGTLAARGAALPRSVRRVVAAALADRGGVAVLVRERMRQVGEIARAAAPVVETVGGHCVLLEPEQEAMAFLAWLYAETGVRAAPHLAADGRVRLAVPVGLSAPDATEVARRLAAALPRAGAAPELVAAAPVRTLADLATATYHPAAAVPDDVAEALREGRRARDDNAAVLRESQPATERHLVPYGGGRLEVFTAGQGPAIVLLPPFNLGAGVFAEQFAGLAGSHRVIAVHHAGVGATTGVDDITLDGLADLVAGALDGVGEDRPVHVAGASFGGLTALTFALRHPGRTASLTLLGSSYKIGNRVGELNRLDVVAREDLAAVATGTGAEPAGGRDRLQELLLRCESMDPHTGLRFLDVFAARPDLTARLPEIAVPTLILQGRYDTVIPLKTAHLLHGAIPDSRYVEIPDAGHFPSLTTPELVNRELAGFVAATGSAVAGAGR